MRLFYGKSENCVIKSIIVVAAKFPFELKQSSLIICN